MLSRFQCSDDQLKRMIDSGDTESFSPERIALLVQVRVQENCINFGGAELLEDD